MTHVAMQLPLLFTATSTLGSSMDVDKEKNKLQQDSSLSETCKALSEVTIHTVTTHNERAQIRQSIEEEIHKVDARFASEKAAIEEEIRKLQSTLDEVRQEYHSKISHWRTRLNVVSPPIHLLPEEILCQTFLLVAQSSERYKEWKAITLVCVQWRKLSFDCPALWVRPDFRRLEIGRKMAERAKDLPLNIYLATNMGLKNVHAGLEYLASAGRLAFTSGLDTNLDDFNQLAVPAPKLEHVELALTHKHHNHPSILPNDLFALDAPRLQTMLLELVNIPWVEEFVGAFSSITVLRLKMSIAPGRRDDTSPCIDVMSQLRLMSPRLRCLELQDVFHPLDPVNATYFDRNGDIVFPQLQNLAIQATSAMCELIFSHFTYPPTSAVKISGLWNEDTSQEAPAHDYESIRRVLDTVFGRVKSPVAFLMFGYLGIMANYQDHMLKERLTFVTKEQEAQSEMEDGNPPHFSIGLPSIKSFEGSWKSLPLQDLERLQFLLHDSKEFDWGFFSRLSKLSAIDLSGEHDTLVEALRVPQAGTDLPMGFAALKELQMLDWDFRTDDDYKPRRKAKSKSKKIPSDINLDDICALIKEREKEGAGIAQLIVGNCTNVTDYQLHALNEVVEDVVWLMTDPSEQNPKIRRSSL